MSKVPSKLINIILFFRTELDPDDAKFYIYVEEPFDLINTARYF